MKGAGHLYGHFLMHFRREDETEGVRNEGLNGRAFTEELTDVVVLCAAYHTECLGAGTAKVSAVEGHGYHPLLLAAVLPHKAEAVRAAAGAHHNGIGRCSPVAVNIALSHNGDADCACIDIGELGQEPDEARNENGGGQDDPLPSKGFLMPAYSLPEGQGLRC